MTQDRRNRWKHIGQLVAAGTLVILGVGAAAYASQAPLSGSDQIAVNLSQATTTAALAERLTGVTERLAKVEAQNNYVLMAVVGSLIAQLVQLRVGKGR